MYRMRAVFDAMAGVDFGRPDTEAAIAQIDHVHATRSPLTVGGSLQREMSEIDKGAGPEHFDRIEERALGMPWIPGNPAGLMARGR